MPRDVFVIGPMTTGFFAVLPIGGLLIWLWLVISAEIMVVLVLRRECLAHFAPATVATQDQDVMRLLRQVVPHLRSRRSQPVIEEQQRWREAAEARRHARVHRREAP